MGLEQRESALPESSGTVLLLSVAFAAAMLLIGFSSQIGVLVTILGVLAVLSPAVMVASGSRQLLVKRANSGRLRPACPTCLMLIMLLLGASLIGWFADYSLIAAPLFGLIGGAAAFVMLNKERVRTAQQAAAHHGAA